MKTSNNKRSGRITIREIAERAGVSISLVSSFLTGRDYRQGGKAGIRIGPETAEHIRQTCRTMGYWPEKPIAFSRIYPELSEICLLYPKSGEGYQGNRYFSLVLGGVLDAAMAIGTKTSVAYFDAAVDYAKHPDALPFPVVDAGVRKFILASTPNRSLLDELVRLRKHVVYISRKVDLETIASVVPDYRQAAYVALSHLEGLGHRRIGLVASRFFNDSYNSVELRVGIRHTVDLLGLELPEEDLYPEKMSIPDTIDRLFSRGNPPTALFGFDDYSAEEAMMYLKEKGLSVPGEVSVIGCNDEKAAALFDPPLTTVHIRTHQLGRQAVKLVNQIMESPDKAIDRHLVIPVYLVERGSTRRLD